MNINDIRSWEPYYDPSRYLPEEWQGTALDILRMEAISAKDRMWLVLREECIDARTLRLFAVACARRALGHIQDPDPRSVAACDVAERYANGEATDEELESANRFSYDAYYATAATGDRTSASAAASAASASAPYSALACYASVAFAGYAASASAAYRAERDWQVAKLVDMLNLLTDA